WRFYPNQNLLEINTSGNVQPQAQLIFNPTRLVIDLPGVKIKTSQLTQPGRGVREIRIGQFDEQTTRIVLELSPGYTLDPNQVKFVPKRANRWTVQLPKLQRESLSPQGENPENTTNNNYNLANIVPQSKPEFSTIANSSGGKTQLENLQITGDGFFLRTNGPSPQTRTIRSRDQTTIFVDILDTTLSPNSPASLTVNKYGVSRIDLHQLRTTPTSVRMTLRVEENSPDWRVTSSSSGLVLLPSRGIVNLPENENLPPSINNNENNGSIATIESVEIVNNGTQLLIRSDQTVSATTGWDRKSGLFR
ncbi:MAG: AMIN domain-containing protein, partial [Dolichospermum sp.]